ncbi:MAG: putative porin [Verrucomicrobiota bacterium]|jgi:hypothetical protein
MMKRNYFARLGVVAGTALSLALTHSAVAQSVDKLLDKLVSKGVLTVQEANDLKQESDEGFNQAFQVKTGMPDWVTGYKLGGDFRGRFEQNAADDNAYVLRNRYRYRLRFGAVVSMTDHFEVGFRLSSGNPQTNPGGTLVGGQPITANQDMNSLESRKFIWIDAAYAKWTPINSGDWTVSTTIGKMDNPFQLSNMVWDYDIDPEGLAIQAAHNFSDRHTLKANGAFFVLDELNQPNASTPTLYDPSHDPYVLGGQLVFESKWTPKFETALGAAGFVVGHKDSLSATLQPFYNSGNTRNGTGFLVYDYTPVIGTASATYKLDSFPGYSGAFPIKVAGEFMHNPGAPQNNNGYRVGLTLGKAATKRQWEISYRFQELQPDAWFDAMVDDDNGAYYATGNPQLVGTGKLNGWFGGTNVKGNLVQATYMFTDFLNFTFTYYWNDLIINAPGQSSSASHLMADLNWKF